MLARAADPRMVAVARAIAGVCYCVIAATAVVALAGWTFRVDVLKGAMPGSVPMNPLTALGFLVAVASLVILSRIEAGPGWRSRQFAQVLAIVVVFIGAQRLFAYFVGW